jgi:predicted  nucleic acid-binding Zn-ribbon protein
VIASRELVINDALTYSSAKDFRSREAAVLYKQLIEARQQLCTLNSQLEKSRSNYSKATGAEKNTLKREILQAETDLTQLYSQIQTLEKETRNAEIKIIQ